MDDSRLAYLFSDGTIRIWLLDTGERIRESSSEIGQRLEGQEGEITLCRNLTIITCNDKDKGGQLSLRHADTGDVVERYDLPPGYSKSVQISQNSQYIAFVGSDNTPVLLHIDATDCPRHIYLHNSTAVAFISGDSGRYAVWNLETCDFIRQRHRSNRCIQDMIWCDSSLLTSVSFSLTQKSWVILAYSDEDGRNMATLEWLHSGKLICHLQTENDSIQEIYFSPDNTTLALVSWNGAVEARKIATEECLAISEVEGDYDLTTLSPTFDLVASVEKDHTTIVRRNDLHESEEEDHPIYLLALSPDQRHIASASYGNVPCLWDVLTSDGIHELYPVTVPDRFVGWTNSFQFSPNSGHFCVHKGGFVSNVLLEIWYVKTGQHVRNIRDENSWCEDNNMRTELQGTISPDGRWIFTIREHGLSLWVLDELSSPRELAFQGTVCDVMFSPDSLLMPCIQIHESKPTHLARPSQTEHQDLTLLRCTPETLLRTDKNLAPLEHIGKSAVHDYTDQQPVNINNLASVPAVSALLLKENRPLNALRFRANIWITAAGAFDEETWKRYRILPMEKDAEHVPPTLYVVCRTSRCTMPNVNLISGKFDTDAPGPDKKRGRAQPSTTMVQHRTVEDGNPKALGYIGMHCVPEDANIAEAADSPKGLYIHVGDEIGVLERGSHFYGSTGNDY
ncbi:quinon protein alcohol dehydrogenase-like superfamily [Fusarium venenatum]|uniref:quinon protein alcohol dehydrogenase-like superfamily n=1 Tax=Fusarium venenatum TaxID=56646 RepID=UPI001DFB7296|nr:quinon protein alcohol dehydrogenase-like superfamily [Fusarium venenatum]